MSNSILPYVTFVIPTRNEESNIEECLEGILGQDYPRDRYEIIVADGHSVDRTQDIAKSHGARVIVNDKIIQSAARNLAASNAKGELLTFIDADVILGKEWLKQALEELRRPNVAAVGNFPGVKDDSTWTEKVWFFYYQSKFTKDKCVSAAWLDSASMVFKKDIFFKIGGFDESMKYAEDVDLGLRTSRNGYLLIFNPHLKSIHSGYEKSISGFIMKQFTGGRAILQLINNNGIMQNWRIAFFISYFLFFIVNFILGVFLSFTLSIVCLFFMVILAVSVSFHRCYNAKSYVYLLPLSFLLFLSGMVRATALVLPSRK